MSNLVDITYFPGCALEGSAREAKLSLELAARILGLNLIELDDWNCCGSSSVNALDKDIGFSLAVRNLSLASPERLLMTMCPLCVYYLRKAQFRLREDPEALRAQEQRWGRPGLPRFGSCPFHGSIGTPGTGASAITVGSTLAGAEGCPLLWLRHLSRRPCHVPGEALPGGVGQRPDRPGG